MHTCVHLSNEGGDRWCIFFVIFIKNKKLLVIRLRCCIELLTIPHRTSIGPAFVIKHNCTHFWFQLFIVHCLMESYQNFFRIVKTVWNTVIRNSTFTSSCICTYVHVYLRWFNGSCCIILRNVWWFFYHYRNQDSFKVSPLTKWVRSSFANKW